MAKLKSNDLTLEIKFDSFDNGWLNYDIKYYWKEEIIINDNILKKESIGWKRRSYGTFLANDYQKDYLIETIKKALDTYRVECWEPIEPDAKIAIYPGRFFPFLKTPYNFFEEMEEIRLRIEKREKRYDDLFYIITFIDTHNFKDSSFYSGGGISLHIISERKDLEKFVLDLETEYNNLIHSMRKYPFIWR